MACSFARYSGSPCGINPRYSADVDVVSLAQCQKDIKAHLSYYKFSGIEDEAGLILARTGTFNRPRNEDLMKLTICPFHRDVFGVGWKRPSRMCAVRDSIAAHKGRNKPVRGIGKALSQHILANTNCLIPVGSGNFFFNKCL